MIQDELVAVEQRPPHVAQRLGHVALALRQQRLGQPQLYLHQGTCEHLFMVSSFALLLRSSAERKE